MECSAIFDDFISNCQDAIVINALLEPATIYKWVITTPNHTEYEGEFTTDANGVGEIDVDDLPPSLLNQYAGTFFLQLFDTPYQCRKVNFIMGKQYDAISFFVRPGTAIKPNLGCAFTCIEGSGVSDNSALFPFTDVPDYDLPWTSLLLGLYGNNPTLQVWHETSPGVYELAVISITQTRDGGGILTDVFFDNGGNASGYLIVNA